MTSALNKAKGVFRSVAKFKYRANQIDYLHTEPCSDENLKSSIKKSPIKTPDNALQICQGNETVIEEKSFNIKKPERNGKVFTESLEQHDDSIYRTQENEPNSKNVSVFYVSELKVNNELRKPKEPIIIEIGAELVPKDHLINGNFGEIGFAQKTYQNKLQEIILPADDLSKNYQSKNNDFRGITVIDNEKCITIPSRSIKKEQHDLVKVIDSGNQETSKQDSNNHEQFSGTINQYEDSRNTLTSDVNKSLKLNLNENNYLVGNKLKTNYESNSEDKRNDFKNSNLENNINPDAQQEKHLDNFNFPNNRAKSDDDFKNFPYKISDPNECEIQLENVLIETNREDESENDASKIGNSENVHQEKVVDDSNFVDNAATIFLNQSPNLADNCRIHNLIDQPMKDLKLFMESRKYFSTNEYKTEDVSIPVYKGISRRHLRAAFISLLKTDEERNEYDLMMTSSTVNQDTKLTELSSSKTKQNKETNLDEENQNENNIHLHSVSYSYSNENILSEEKLEKGNVKKRSSNKLPMQTENLWLENMGEDNVENAVFKRIHSHKIRNDLNEKDTLTARKKFENTNKNIIQHVLSAGSDINYTNEAPRQEKYVFKNPYENFIKLESTKKSANLLNNSENQDTQNNYKKEKLTFNKTSSSKKTTLACPTERILDTIQMYKKENQKITDSTSQYISSYSSKIKPKILNKRISESEMELLEFQSDNKTTANSYRISNRTDNKDNSKTKFKSPDEPKLEEKFAAQFNFTREQKDVDDRLSNKNYNLKVSEQIKCITSHGDKSIGFTNKPNEDDAKETKMTSSDIKTTSVKDITNISFQYRDHDENNSKYYNHSLGLEDNQTHLRKNDIKNYINKKLCSLQNSARKKYMEEPFIISSQKTLNRIHSGKEESLSSVRRSKSEEEKLLSNMSESFKTSEQKHSTRKKLVRNEPQKSVSLNKFSSGKKSGNIFENINSRPPILKPEETSLNRVRSGRDGYQIKELKNENVEVKSTLSNVTKDKEKRKDFETNFRPYTYSKSKIGTEKNELDYSNRTDINNKSDNLRTNENKFTDQFNSEKKNREVDEESDYAKEWNSMKKYESLARNQVEGNNSVGKWKPENMHERKTSIIFKEVDYPEEWNTENKYENLYSKREKNFRVEERVFREKYQNLTKNNDSIELLNSQLVDYMSNVRKYISLSEIPFNSDGYNKQKSLKNSRSNTVIENEKLCEVGKIGVYFLLPPKHLRNTTINERCESGNRNQTIRSNKKNDANERVSNILNEANGKHLMKSENKFENLEKENNNLKKSAYNTVHFDDFSIYQPKNDTDDPDVKQCQTKSGKKLTFNKNKKQDISLSETVKTELQKSPKSKQSLKNTDSLSSLKKQFFPTTKDTPVTNLKKTRSKFKLTNDNRQEKKKLLSNIISENNKNNIMLSEKYKKKESNKLNKCQVKSKMAESEVYKNNNDAVYSASGKNKQPTEHGDLDFDFDVNELFKKYKQIQSFNILSRCKNKSVGRYEKNKPNIDSSRGQMKCKIECNIEISRPNKTIYQPDITETDHRITHNISPKDIKIKNYSKNSSLAKNIYKNINNKSNATNKNISKNNEMSDYTIETSLPKDTIYKPYMKKRVSEISEKLHVIKNDILNTIRNVNQEKSNLKSRNVVDDIRKVFRKTVKELQESEKNTSYMNNSKQYSNSNRNTLNNRKYSEKYSNTKNVMERKGSSQKKRGKQIFEPIEFEFFQAKNGNKQAEFEITNIENDAYKKENFNYHSIKSPNKKRSEVIKKHAANKKCTHFLNLRKASNEVNRNRGSKNNKRQLYKSFYDSSKKLPIDNDRFHKIRSTISPALVSKNIFFRNADYSKSRQKTNKKYSHDTKKNNFKRSFKPIMISSKSTTNSTQRSKKPSFRQIRKGLHANTPSPYKTIKENLRKTYFKNKVRERQTGKAKPTDKCGYLNYDNIYQPRSRLATSGKENILFPDDFEKKRITQTPMTDTINEQEKFCLSNCKIEDSISPEKKDNFKDNKIFLRRNKTRQ